MEIHRSYHDHSRDAFQRTAVHLWRKCSATHQSSRQQSDATSIAQHLTQSGITPSSIKQDGDTTVVILDSAEQQAEAQAILKNHLDESITVALAMEAAAPQWLLNAGFSLSLLA